MLGRRIFSCLPRLSLVLRQSCSTNVSSTTSGLDAFDLTEFEALADEVQSQTVDENISFDQMLRNSKMMQLGDFRGRAVVGKIVHRVEDDLYIDFGLKFDAVCKAPTDERNKYTIGSRVLIRLLNPELSEKFLGSKHDLTLLEADARLLRLFGAPSQRNEQPSVKQEAKEEAVVAA